MFIVYIFAGKETYNKNVYGFINILNNLKFDNNSSKFKDIITLKKPDGSWKKLCSSNLEEILLYCSTPQLNEELLLLYCLKCIFYYIDEVYTCLYTVCIIYIYIYS